jgi:glucose/mannose-6-phosphate isomerase
MMSTPLTAELLRSIDPSGMYERLRAFPDQVREAVAIGGTAPLRLSVRGIRNIVVCGLGGSAIGGDLLRSYLAGEFPLPFIVNRTYTLPRFVGPDSLVIVSSYSGNTEETNAAHREAIRRKARILCITSGGATAALARRRRTPVILIPGGSPPRAALAYSFFPLLVALARLGLATPRERDIRETVGMLDRLRDRYSRFEEEANPALRLARLLQNRISVIYSSTERFDAVNTRWRGQIAENGKALSFGHVLPEMNHNELVGWKALQEQMRDIQVLVLRDRGDHPRVSVRMNITEDVLRQYTPHLTEVWSEGTSLLARIFSLVSLGDWVSLYLAILHREDPTPVAVIDHLKEELGKV